MALRNLDPTRTITLRRGFTRGLSRIFRRLARSVRTLVEHEDAFGLRSDKLAFATNSDPTAEDRTGEVHLADPEQLGLTTNVFCPTGKGGGIDPHCKTRGKVTVSKAEQKLLDAIDSAMGRRVRDYHRTKAEKEKEFGFPLAEPKDVLLRDVGRYKREVVQSLLEKGLVDLRTTSLGEAIRRTDLPPDFYKPQSGEPVSNKRWAYSTNEQAAEQFEKWLKQQVEKELLTEAEALRWRRYVRRGFEVGANRALNDVERGRGKGAKARRFLDTTRGGDFVEGQREAFLRTTLSKSSAVEKLRLLQSSALSEVRSVGADLVPKMRRVLVDSLVRNLSPRETAQRLQKVLKISEGRARTIANTELVRAHAEGQLEAMEQLGVEKVGVAVEWSSLASACALCSPLNHIVLTVKEARGMLPRHPNCRCAWKVANVVESPEEKKQQKRSKSKIDRAVKKSQREAGENDDWKPATEIARTRPQPLLNCSCSDAELSFSALLSKLGIDNDH